MSDTFSDPRAATASVVAAPPELLGPVEIYRPFDVDGRLVALPRPLVAITEYVPVARAETMSIELRGHLLDELDERNGEIPFATNASLILDFYSSAGTTVSEAVIGLEAFSNHFISGHFDERETFEFGGNPLSRADVYNMPLNKRLADVLPAIQSVERPTSGSWWPVFRRVQALAALKRHGVFDPVKRSGLAGEKPLIQRFVDGEHRGAARMMLDIFEFFAPGWVAPQRAAELPSPPPD